MTLPKLTHPTKKILIPSIGKDLEFEPFTTADEKRIVLLDENATAYDKVLAQVEVLEKCCQDKSFDFHSLSVVEISYIFLQLRKISVGGELELISACPECKEEFPITIDISLVKFDPTNLKPLQFTVQTDEGPYIIMCTQVTLDDLKYMDVKNPKMDDAAVVLRKMMKPDGNDIIDLTQDEKLELFNQLDSKDAKKIVEYIASAPKLSYHLDIICPECSHQYGGDLEDFFI